MLAISFGIRMRFSVIGCVLSVTIATASAAQNAPQRSGDIAYFHVNKAKPGMTAQYETARKRHWVWHQKMKDTWSFHVWQIVSGEASGTYMVCSFDHSWKDVDESDQKVGGEEDDPAAKVEPYLDGEWESYYRYLPDLSAAPRKWSKPSAKLAVMRVLVKPEELETFVAAQTKIKEAMVKAVYSERIRWYQLLTGGEIPQFLMLVERDNWAAYEQSPDEEFGSILERAYGKNQAADIRRDIGNAIRSQYVETWQYRADLSFVAGEK